MHKSKGRRGRRPAALRWTLPMAIITAAVVIPQLSLKLWGGEPKIVDLPTAIHDRHEHTPEYLELLSDEATKLQVREKNVTYRGSSAN